MNVFQKSSYTYEPWYNKRQTPTYVWWNFGHQAVIKNIYFNKGDLRVSLCDIQSQVTMRSNAADPPNTQAQGTQLHCTQSDVVVSYL